MPFERYGMPSGHTQLVFYSTIFTYFALKNIKLITFYLIISLLTLYQRVKSQQHFFSQTIFGALVGSLLGYGFYKYTRDHLQGPLKMKPDDNAPI
jgi:membrane-associated phospholipid phosphatase